MAAEKVCVLPNDCIFAFCLPLDHNWFRSTSTNPTGYAAQYKGGWAQYQKLFANEAEGSLREYELLGVEVRAGVTGETFAGFLRGDIWKVVVLFSHWDEEAGVEFADRFWNPLELTRLFPENANCIVDLSVCHPVELVRRVASERKQVRLCWTEVRRTPLVWFSFYDSLFRVLSKGSYTYFEAFRETATAYIREFGGPLAQKELECFQG